LYGRCGCNLDSNANALEALWAGRNRLWEGRVDREKIEGAESEGLWINGLRRVLVRFCLGCRVVEYELHGPG
jgi:hypothetical protein